MPQNLTEIKALLAQAGLRPRKRFGQNFLIDANKLDQIVALADLKPGELVLEVGPGTGALTERLGEAGARVIAVEIDHDLSDLLRDQFGEDHARWRLISGDVLAGKHALNPTVAAALRDDAQSFKLIANLPYNIASPLLAVLATDYPTMSMALVMVQREVADRIVAEPGGKQFGPLTVMIQAMMTAERVMRLPPGCFWPQPKIESAVVRLTRRAEALTGDPVALAGLVTKLFTRRRKQLGSIIGRDQPLPAGVQPTLRPEQLTVEQLCELAHRLNRPGESRTL